MTSQTPAGATAATKVGPIRADSAVEVRPVGDRGAVIRRRLAYAVLIGYALLMFVPFAWTVVTSLKTLPDSVRLTFIPQPFTTQGWDFAINSLDPSLPTMFVNSFIIAGAVTVSNLVLGSMAGYAFARLRFPGREVLFLVVLATLMIPDQLRLVPVYLILNSVGLTRGDAQYLGVVVILAIAGTSIFLMRQYFLTIPRDLEEAAKIDGAGFFTTFWRVMLPLATPALAAVAILQFQGTWNGFFWPLVILQEADNYTVTIGLSFFRLAGGYSNNWPPLMAVVVMATIPILILYIFFQRYFVEGIAASGVKG
jgi:multiple sugar transport system permease protein